MLFPIVNSMLLNVGKAMSKVWSTIVNCQLSSTIFVFSTDMYDQKCLLVFKLRLMPSIAG